MMRDARRLLALFVFGGIGLAACDQIHLRFGVLRYPHPTPGLFGQPWWVPCLFGLATIVIVATALPFARAARPRTPEAYVSPYASGGIWFLAAYLLSGLAYRWPVPLAILYLVTFVLRVIWRGDRAPILGYAALLAAGGTLFEAWLSSTGAFAYTVTPWWLVPLWLPGLYLHGAPLAIAVTQRIDARRASD